MKFKKKNHLVVVSLCGVKAVGTSRTNHAVHVGLGNQPRYAEQNEAIAVRQITQMDPNGKQMNQSSWNSNMHTWDVTYVKENNNKPNNGNLWSFIYSWNINQIFPSWK